MSRIVLFTALIAANLASFEVLTPRYSTIAVYNGQIKGWGQNNKGQLVTGNTDTQSVPTGVFNLGPDSTGADFVVDYMKCGLWHYCALTAARDMKCWGFSRAIGWSDSPSDSIGSNPNDVGNIPLVTAFDNIVDVALLNEITCVLQESGGVFSVDCVGDDMYAHFWADTQYGDPITFEDGPVALPGFADKTSSWSDVKISGGYWTLCVWDPNTVDALECWGSVAVDSTVVGGHAFQSLQCARWHCCAMTTDGSLVCWGSNDEKTDLLQLGDDFGAVQDYATAHHSTCVLSASGKVKCIGDDHYGELGGGAFDIPSDFSASGARLATSGRHDDHHCLYEEGASELLVKCWGRDAHDALGPDSIDLGWEVVPPPTSNPTAAPSSAPSSNPSSPPTSAPSSAPSSAPTLAPSLAPSLAPTSTPSSAPTSNPTSAPTANPTQSPTLEPTDCCECPEPSSTESVSAHYIARGNPLNQQFEDPQVSFHCHDDENNQALYSSDSHGFNIGVGCCNEDGSVGDRPDCSSHPATYQQAFDLCADNGLRLCTLQETISGVTQGKGCSYDAAYQWVSDSCSVPAIRSMNSAAMSVPALIAETSESKESVADFTFVTLGAVVGVLVVTVILLIVVVIQRKRRRKLDDGLAMSEVTAPKVEPVQSMDGIDTI